MYLDQWERLSPGMLLVVATLVPFLVAAVKLVRPLSIVFVLALAGFVVRIVHDDCRAQPQQPCESDQILEFVGTSLVILACVATVAGWLLGDTLRRRARRNV
jgi:uncharacterized membrane protein AbrB (regulator of aidB expression)